MNKKEIGGLGRNGGSSAKRKHQGKWLKVLFVCFCKTISLAELVTMFFRLVAGCGFEFYIQHQFFDKNRYEKGPPINLAHRENHDG